MDCFQKSFEKDRGTRGTASYTELEKIIIYCWVLSNFTVFK